MYYILLQFFLISYSEVLRHTLRSHGIVVQTVLPAEIPHKMTHCPGMSILRGNFIHVQSFKLSWTELLCLFLKHCTFCWGGFAYYFFIRIESFIIRMSIKTAWLYLVFQMSSNMSLLTNLCLLLMLFQPWGMPTPLQGTGCLEFWWVLTNLEKRISGWVV